MPQKNSRSKGTLRTCANGHRYMKSSDCPVCPVCAKDAQPTDGLLSTLAAPAARALQQAGITDVQTLARFTEKEISALHGIGPSVMKVLREKLAAVQLSFRSH